ncbi:type II secretion system protein [Acidobacteria bacterium AB60]|nr:type II secretion system protein [Acidobacteria bacterium AB60]
MRCAAPTRPRNPAEAGYMLVSVIILLAIFLIAMSVAAPRVADSIRRDREVEAMHRGKQYIRAIQLYYRKFHAYPPNLDALVKTNEIRFLRKKYVDPLTGKDDWKPIMFCQNKTPMAMGFFGQPLGGTGCGAIAGIGPSGGNGMQGANLLSASTTPGGMFSNTAGATGSTAAVGSAVGGTDSSAQVDANGTPINNSGSPMGNGPTFGGGGIVGVTIPNPKQSILVYKKKNHYNEWEFLYSPLQDQQIMAGGNAGGMGQPMNGTPGMTQPGSGILPNGIGGPGTNPSSGIGSSPFNNNGSTPIQPPPDPPSTTPQ